MGGLWYEYAIIMRSVKYIIVRESRAIGNIIGMPGPKKNVVKTTLQMIANR